MPVIKGFDSRRKPHSKYYIGRFLGRDNRFIMRVELNDGSLVEAYCPNTSRLIGLLEGDPEVLLTKNDKADRKTNFTIRAFRNDEIWVGIEAVRANDIFEKYLASTERQPFEAWENWEREVSFDSSQFDFRCKMDELTDWVEVKSLSSRTSEGKAFYSGTPSKRGYRHLDHLSELAEQGDRARCVFVVQRSDVDGLVPADVTQGEWLDALRHAADRDVDIRAYRCEFDGLEWTIKSEIPAYL